MAKILVVEDTEDIAELVVEKLAALHNSVDLAEDGNRALDFLKTYQYDLVVLDVNIPGPNGFEVLDFIRKRGGSEKVLMLTTRGDIEDRLTGFSSGADDYLTKPFDSRELQARIMALLSRPVTLIAKVLKWHNVELNKTAREVRCAGVMVRLQPKDFDLLEFLMHNPNETFAAETLLDRVWTANSNVSIEGLRTAISRIRKALDDGSGVPVIENVNRIGYRLRALDTKKN
jgi:DNA-binding response OmpR family regulator